jgi:hypothetical protein
MLTVDDEAFWEGLTPVTFGQLPRLQDQVTVIGYVHWSLVVSSQGFRRLCTAGGKSSRLRCIYAPMVKCSMAFGC